MDRCAGEQNREHRRDQTRIRASCHAVHQTVVVAVAVQDFTPIVAVEVTLTVAMGVGVHVVVVVVVEVVVGLLGYVLVPDVSRAT